MAKTLRTSGDYTIKAGAGFNTGTGEHNITLDSRYVRITGDLTIDGEQTVINTQTLSVEDAILVLNRNDSSNAITGSDSGIIINRGEVGINAAFYWDESLNLFKAVTTSSGGGGALGTTITDLALTNIRVAEPSNNSDAATKYYVDNSAAGMSSFSLAGDSGTTQTVADANTVTIAGSTNISTAASSADTITINLNQNLNNINSISNGSTNGELTLTANGTGSVIVNNILTFNSNASTPTATAITKLYSKTVGGGGTGVFFINSAVGSGTEDELISKKKATALAIALG